MHSKLDRLYRSVLFSKFFVKGWGSPKIIKDLLEFKKVINSREACLEIVGNDYPLFISRDVLNDGEHIVEGCFRSPLDSILPSLLPEESKTAYFQLIQPKKWENEDLRPVCIHMAGTGDHYFWRRRYLMARPLLRESGIASVLLENPFYGLRKPAGQVRSALLNVSDIFVMGASLILEGLVLLQWLKRQGYGPLGVTGLSMGGHMASLVASSWPHPLVLVPCLSWSTASGVFTEGVMSRSINWDVLECQYKEDLAFRAEVESIVRTSGETLLKGRTLAADYTSSDEAGRQNFVKRQLLRSPIARRLAQAMRKRFAGGEDTSLIFRSLNRALSPSNQYEAVDAMKVIMDEFTHLKNFAVPVDTSLIISVCARNDGYVPRNGVAHLTDIWPGAEVRYVEAGHISAILLHQAQFRRIIAEAYNRYRMKYSKNDQLLSIDDSIS